MLQGMPAFSGDDVSAALRACRIMRTLPPAAEACICTVRITVVSHLP